MNQARANGGVLSEARGNLGSAVENTAVRNRTAMRSNGRGQKVIMAVEHPVQRSMRDLRVLRPACSTTV
jgi:hypothetical protein